MFVDSLDRRVVYQPQVTLGNGRMLLFDTHLPVKHRRKFVVPIDPPCGWEYYTSRKDSSSSAESIWLGRRGLYLQLTKKNFCFCFSFADEKIWNRKVAIPALNDSPYIGMNVYNVVLTSIIVVFCGSLLSERTTLYYIVVAALILTSTTTALCLLFLPKVRIHKPNLPCQVVITKQFENFA